MAMSIGDLFPIVLTLTLVGITLGVGLLILGKFSVASGITADASTGVNNTITAINDLPSTWLPIIVVVVAAAIIVTLVVRSFRA
jgi:type II secretory pathway component PulF